MNGLSLFWEWFKHIPWLEASGETSLLEIYISVALQTGYVTPVFKRGWKKESIRADSAQDFCAVL